ncbi:MAG: hypothetical protein HY556_11420 [Euryarchaeota archaeon]|nr:hypothetical protein [Euryarchaeota archaeon]
MNARLKQRRTLLNLNYDDLIPKATLLALETKARDCGLDLETLELLGQDESVALGFILEANISPANGMEYIKLMDFAHLASLRAQREKPLAQGSPVSRGEAAA